MASVLEIAIHRSSGFLQSLVISSHYRFSISNMNC